MSIALLILGIILLASSVYFNLRPHIPAVIPAYGGLWVLQWGEWLTMPSVMLSYWGVMVMIVIIITSMQPQTIVKATQGLPHITIGSVCAMLTGATIGYAAMVIGAFAGAIVGGIYFARTPKGKGLAFPSKRFLQYLCAKGLPTVITVSLLGIAIMVAAAEYRWVLQ